MPEMPRAERRERVLPVTVLCEHICIECKNADKRKSYAEKQAQREVIRLAEIERYVMFLNRKEVTND